MNYFNIGAHIVQFCSYLRVEFPFWDVINVPKSMRIIANQVVLSTIDYVEVVKLLSESQTLTINLGLRGYY